MHISRTFVAAVAVGVAVLWGASLFAVSGDGGGDRKAAIGAQGQEAPDDREKRPAEPPGQLNAVAAKLGKDRSAGTYFDPETEKWVVAVLESDENAAAEVRREGGQPKLVKHSGAKLDATERDLKPEVAVDGVAYGVDIVNNRVLISVDSTVKPAQRAKIAAAVQATSGAATLEDIPGKIQLMACDAADNGGKEFPRAGRDMYMDSTGCQTTCSAGFNLTNGYFLTAGHCDRATFGCPLSGVCPYGAVLGHKWDTGRGDFVAAEGKKASFPTNDYMLMRYTSADDRNDARAKLWTRDPNWYDGNNPHSQAITSAGDAYVGQSVQKSGHATRVSRGSVTALNQTVTIEGRAVSGLIRTNLCSSAGDSGGPLYAGTVALGILSSAVAGCTQGKDTCGVDTYTGTGPTFFQPVKEALAAYADVAQLRVS